MALTERKEVAVGDAAKRLPEQCSPRCTPPVHYAPCPTAYAIQEAEWETR